MENGTLQHTSLWGRERYKLGRLLKGREGAVRPYDGDSGQYCEDVAAKCENEAAVCKQVTKHRYTITIQ